MNKNEVVKQKAESDWNTKNIAWNTFDLRVEISLNSVILDPIEVQLCEHVKLVGFTASDSFLPNLFPSLVELLVFMPCL